MINTILFLTLYILLGILIMMFFQGANKGGKYND